MKSLYSIKPFNSWIVTVCFAIFLILLIPLQGFAQTMAVSGNVYIDLDGSAGLNKVDGVGIGVVDGHQLYATIANVGTGLSFVSTAVAADGSYSFFLPATFTFSIIISTTNYTSGMTPVALLPSGWMFNGEINNNSSNSLTGNDGTSDGKVINVPGANETHINFGIGQRPTVNNMTTTICAGNTFTVTPVNGTDGIVPAGTSYSWSAPSGTGFTGGLASSGSPTIISGTLNSTNNSAHLATYTITPTSGAGSTGSPFSVNVTVYPLPVFTTCPSNISLNSDPNQCNALVSYTATAQAIQGFTTTLSYVFTGATTGSGSGTGNGSTFNVGVTNVTITATNSCGTTNCSFTVTIIDNINPTITCPPDVNAITNTGCTATGVVLGTPVVADNCGVASVVNNAPSAFPLGVTTVIWKVTDNSGNTATCNQTVTVTDVNNTCGTCNFLTNTDFEIPVVSSSVPGWSSPGFIQTPEINVPSWHTTASDGKIEIWDGRPAAMNAPAYSGNQFAELNCTQIGTLYQNFTAVSGTAVLISFAHRGRYTGLDKMAVTIGPVGGPFVAVDTCYDNFAGGWSYYSLPYTFPSSGPYQIRFASIYSNGGVYVDIPTPDVKRAGGNWLDAITIACPTPGGPTITPGGPDNVCQSATPVPITLIGAGIGGSATTGAWSIISGGGTLSSTLQTATPSLVTYTPVANFSGTVILKLLSNGSPALSATRTITVNAQPAAPAAITGTTTVCIGSTTQLFDTTVGGVWSSVSTGVATISNPSMVSPGGIISPVSAGTSLIIYTVSNGTCTNSVTQLVTVNPLPTATAGGPNSVCQSATPTALTLNGASIGGGTTSGAWSIISGGGNLSSTAQTANPETITYTPAANYSGPVILRLTSNNPNSCGIATSDRTITVNPLPTVAVITGTANVCVGSTTQLANATSFGSWSSGSPVIATVSAGGVGGSGGLVTGVSAGTSLITYTVNNGTCSNSVTQLVTVNPFPTDTAGGPNSVCQSATPVAITLSGASIGGGATTGAWSIISGGGNLSSTAQTANPETITYTPAANYSGPVILRLTSNNPNSCGIATSDRTITVNPLPTVAPINGTTTVCVGSTTQLADVTGGGIWSSGSTNIALINASGVVTGVSPGTSVISYSVSNMNGCKTIVTILVTVIALPTIPVTLVTQPTCSVATGTITVTVQNVSDMYSFDNGVSFQASNIKSGLVAGSYNVIIKSIGGCSSAVSSATINALPTTPTTPIVGTVTQPTCSLATGSIVLSGLPSGSWKINPGAISGSTISTTISGLVAGTYNFTVTNSVGCNSAASTSVFINSQPNAPTIPVISVTQQTCSVATGTITVTVQNASDSYSFDNGVTYQASNIKSGLVAGNYNVIIKSIGGCSSVVSPATINALPTTPATPIVGTVTQPTCSLATGSIVLSGLPSGSWKINPGNITGSTTSSTISGLTAATYNFTVTNSTGCNSAASASVVINSQPTTPTIPITSVTQPSCSVATGTITVTVQNASDSYSFDNGVSFQASNIKSGLVAGSYNVIIKSIGGCSSGLKNTIVNVAPDCNNIDLKVVETVNATIAIVGQPVVFTIVATNNGPDNATGSLVTVKLPDGYTLVSNTSTIGTYDSTTGVWTIGSLNNGQSETLTIIATVNSSGNYVLTSIIQCNEVEVTLVNNISSGEIVPTDLFIPDGYTPNGDGYNDKFVIKHAVSVKIEIEIYNRWGNLVYQNIDYQNDWDGKGSGNLLGKDLPGGTYYCGIKVINISTGVLVGNHLKYITLRR